MGIAAAIGVLSPFPFYYWLWSYPQTWVELCGKGRNPCKVMAYEAHCLPLFTSVPSLPLASSSTSVIIFLPICRVYQLLGESGTYYGVQFPFGYMKDPQYVPFQYILLWTLGYVGMISVESKEDPATRAKPLS
ncbi:unnamed protein product [Malus baccata var. baccata]